MAIYHVIYGGAPAAAGNIADGACGPFPIWYGNSNALRRERSAVCHGNSFMGNIMTGCIVGWAHSKFGKIEAKMWRL